MKTNKILCAAVISAFVCACSPKQPAQQTTAGPDNKPQGVLTDAQKKTLKKAKQTEELLDKTAKDRMKEVDEATGEK